MRLSIGSTLPIPFSRNPQGSALVHALLRIAAKRDGQGEISTTQQQLTRRGAAIIELALLITILIFILVASLDFARLFYDYLTVTNCARNGAIYGSLNTTQSQDSSGIKTAALADAGSLTPQPTVDTPPTTGNDANGNPYVAVTVRYTFTTLINWPGIPHTMNLSRTAQMRVIQGTPN